MKSLRWWFRGIRLLRYPALVRALGEMQARWSILEAIRLHHASSGLRLSSSAIMENWEPQRLKVGVNVSIGHGTILSWPEDGEAVIEIGSDTWIGPYNNLRTAKGGRLVIGDNCLISQFCTLITHNHGVNKHQLIQRQSVRVDRHDVTIGNDVWIGAGAVVLPGVKVDSGAVIAAGSVVCSNVPGYEVWGGVPARKLGERSSST